MSDCNTPLEAAARTAAQLAVAQALSEARRHVCFDSVGDIANFDMAVLAGVAGATISAALKKNATAATPELVAEIACRTCAAIASVVAHNLGLKASYSTLDAASEADLSGAVH